MIPVRIGKCPLGLRACVTSRELIGLRSNSRGFNIRSALTSSAAVLGPQSDTTVLETVVFGFGEGIQPTLRFLPEGFVGSEPPSETNLAPQDFVGMIRDHAAQ